MNSSEVLIDRGVADRGFAAASCGLCQDALACDPACTTAAWHCCHVRERLQVRPLLANRACAWVSVSRVKSVLSVLAEDSCSGKATRDDVNERPRRVKPAKKQTEGCRATERGFLASRDDLRVLRLLPARVACDVFARPWIRLHRTAGNPQRRGLCGDRPGMRTDPVIVVNCSTIHSQCTCPCSRDSRIA